MPTQLSQEQLDLGNQTAIDLLVESNENKDILAATLTNKGTPADASTETWGELLGKTIDLNVEAGRAILDVPIVSRTSNSLGVTDSFTQARGVAWGRWMFYWKTGVLRRIDLKNNTVLPNYDTPVEAGASAVSITVTGVSDTEWFKQQLYIKNNQIVMINTTTLTVYDVDEETGALSVNKTIILGSSIHAQSSICGANSDLSKFLIYDGASAISGSHANFKFVLASDGSVNAASSVPAGSSLHIAPAVYGNDLVFSSTQASPTDDTGIKTVLHYMIDWDNLTLTDTGFSFFCNGSATYANNREVLTSVETSKRYIPYHYNATFLYCLNDGTSTKIGGSVGNGDYTYNNSSCPTVTELSDGGYVVISNYGLPIFLDEDLALIYSSVNDVNNCLATTRRIGTFVINRGEAQIYDEASQTLYAYFSTVIAKFKVYLNKVAGYTRVANGITTPFWSQSTEADIEAGALDKAV